LKSYKDKFEGISAQLEAEKIAKPEKESIKTEIKEWLARAPNNVKEIDG
jgi:hypothetical protein